MLEAFHNFESLSFSEQLDEIAKPLEHVIEKTESIAKSQEALEFFYRPEKPELVTNLEMTEGIASYLESVDDFKFEKWSKLTLEQRSELLNRVEQNIAVLEHRPPLKVELQRMEPEHLGYQSASEHKIVLNSLYVGSNTREMHREVLDTIVHEGRHAYQHYNVDVKMIHESGSEVESWRENFYNPEYQYYHSGTQRILIPYNDGSIHDVDFRLYYYQPVEIDARNFAYDVLTRLEEKGLVSPKEFSM